jgi:hypothetical protein
MGSIPSRWHCEQGFKVCGRDGGGWGMAGGMRNAGMMDGCGMVMVDDGEG